MHFQVNYLLLIAMVMFLVLTSCSTAQQATPSTDPTAGPPPQPALTVQENAIVADAVDSPNSGIDYERRIPSEILQVRKAWRSSPYRDISSMNEVLAPFGYRLALREEKEGRPERYDLYQGKEVVVRDIFPPRSLSTNRSGSDLAMWIEDRRGNWLAQADGVRPWDPMQHGYTAPVFVGDELVRIDADETHMQYAVMSGDQVLFKATRTQQRVDDPIKGLWSWGDRWVLEMDGRVVISGQDLNHELGYDEIFGWRLIHGQPFFFFREGEQTGVSYDGEVLPYRYDEVVHYRCCEPSIWNVGANAHMVWFHARREGTWYYVEMGIYEET